MVPEPPQPRATIGPTRWSNLAVGFVVGGIGGYALGPVSEALNGTAPRVEWSTVVALLLIATVLLGLAYTTHRTVHRLRERMEPHRAVSFLLLAKASALMGAVVAGGYVGFALNFVDDLDIPLPHERAVRSGLAAVTAVGVVVSALLLERACRVRADDD